MVCWEGPMQQNLVLHQESSQRISIRWYILIMHTSLVQDYLLVNACIALVECKIRILVLPLPVERFEALERVPSFWQLNFLLPPSLDPSTTILFSPPPHSFPSTSFPLLTPPPPSTSSLIPLPLPPPPHSFPFPSLHLLTHSPPPTSPTFPLTHSLLPSLLPFPSTPSHSFSPLSLLPLPP